MCTDSLEITYACFLKRTLRDLRPTPSYTSDESSRVNHQQSKTKIITILTEGFLLTFVTPLPHSDSTDSAGHGSSRSVLLLRTLINTGGKIEQLA